MGNNRRTSRRSLLFTVWLVALTGLGWWQRQNIFDWWRLHNYTPSAAIVSIADSSTMTPSARRLFYVFHPALEPKQTFNDHCSTTGEQTIVLGCYIPNTGIYVYDVTDARLNGIKEVTSAHEMLHAAYDRLDSSEKKRVNALIQEAYSNVTDDRIRSTIASYQQAGADTTNELHSILGTEVANLPSDLESYYKKYFNDRAKVVALAAQYESVFTANQKKLQDLNTQIDELKQQLSDERQAIQAEDKSLDSEGNRLNRLYAEGNASEYNAGVDSYNRRVTTLKNRINSFNAGINTLNQLVQEYNSLATAQQGLYQAIDSHSVPQSL